MSKIKTGFKFYKIYIPSEVLKKDRISEEDLVVRRCEVKDERYHRFQYAEFNDTGFVCSWTDYDKFGNVVPSRYGRSIMMEKLDIPLAVEKFIAYSKRLLEGYEEKLEREGKWLTLFENFPGGDSKQGECK